MDKIAWRELVKRHSIDDGLLYLGNALSGEVGEVSNAIKKIKIRKLLEYSVEKVSSTVTMEEYVENLIEELGDVLFYLTGMCSKLGIELEDLMSNQAAKLHIGITFRK
jgi:NTP pyrophosphatase (non-canonical NTP hydrolase)